MATEIMDIIREQHRLNEEVKTVEEPLQYLSFMVGQQTYAANILRVQEIRAWESTTWLPNSPSYLVGVLNLRGIIVPVIDLRIRFAVGDAKYSKTTVVIVFKTHRADKDRLMGCVVDNVSDVIDCTRDNIRRIPPTKTGIDAMFCEGLIREQGVTATILNLDTLLDVDLIEHPFTKQKMLS